MSKYETAACKHATGGTGWRLVFFQAEDGIRYLVRSRGLGDVYKRQPLRLRPATVNELEISLLLCFTGRTRMGAHIVEKPVSYTHLTLPTSDLV